MSKQPWIFVRRLRDLAEDVGHLLEEAWPHLVLLGAVGLLTLMLVAAMSWLTPDVDVHPAPHTRVATVGDVEVYRIGVTTADGRVAECLVTSAGAIDCFEPVEDAW